MNSVKYFGLFITHDNNFVFWQINNINVTAPICSDLYTHIHTHMHGCPTWPSVSPASIKSIEIYSSGDLVSLLRHRRSDHYVTPIAIATLLAKLRVHIYDTHTHIVDNCCNAFFVWYTTRGEGVAAQYRYVCKDDIVSDCCFVWRSCGFTFMHFAPCLA